MGGKNYPANWSEIRQRAKERHRHKCVNCRQADKALEVHHIVPVGQGGSHRLSNLTVLCSRCHSAAHGDRMAPRIRWFTNGKLSSREFGAHVGLCKQLQEQFGVPRYDPDDDCRYVPVGDVERIIELLME